MEWFEIVCDKYFGCDGVFIELDYVVVIDSS